MLDGPVLDRLAARLAEPLRVGVWGRPGAGRRTVVRALRSAGVVTAADGGPDEPGVDVDVYVFTETLTPEDRAAVTSAARPLVAVLNKAELIGLRSTRALGVAEDRCRALQRETGVPIRPLAALLAVAGSAPGVLDEAILEVLRLLAVDPAHADVSRLLRARSGLAAVLGDIDRAAAPVRYRRLLGVLQDLSTAAQPRLARFLVSDAVVLARMAAAAEVVGHRTSADRPDHLREAVRWQRYAHGPVSPLHRACAMDVARGSLRLWARDGGCPRRGHD